MIGKRLHSRFVGRMAILLLLPHLAAAADPPGHGHGGSGPPAPGMQLTFSMDNTNIDIHRMSDSAGFEILIHGVVACTSPVIWSLSPSPYRSFGPADLLLVTNTMGSPVQQGSVSMPLQWELSVNGSAFVPMEVTPDYRLRRPFLPGFYAYTLRITGLPQPYQPAGYYHLRMAQNFVPQL